jgi:hypothetical protein
MEKQSNRDITMRKENQYIDLSAAAQYCRVIGDF